NFVYQDGAIYFHCALTGHRLENLAANSSACLTVTDSVGRKGLYIRCLPAMILHTALSITPFFLMGSGGKV
ncbi:hypothetical protein P0G10_20960, partial [Eubacteriales bacterium DFI.9.88]|nr:hypothetical protein [Eubacteriales bacterium DFI.9.88]